MTTEMTVAPSGAALAEQVAVKGDLAWLTPEQRMAYYGEVCRSLGLNPLTRPFEYITLNGKLTLYATRGAADQLRSLRGITITGLDPRQIGDLYVVVATGRDASGREDSSTGAVNVKGLGGEALANALMKAETKAKRRLTLSLAGLGWSDETESASIPSAVVADIDPETGEVRRPPTLAERVRTRAEAIDPGPAAPGATETGATPVAAASPHQEPARAAIAADGAHGLSFDAFSAAVRGSGATEGQVIDAVRYRFPETKKLSELTDEQRGLLFADIEDALAGDREAVLA